ncbi:AAA family ATPase [Polymorphum gilvum]|uniref:Flp pilus assembly protein, ATPase CpaE n=1 Tax=Polymorphum gilvum (strain LMG 25793 / CGMCC 1.9160 / SL003B-26A1) TaxID=991905 RepID=F2J2Q8_POLGS|nr:CpaE family protein [Polymorphum gilvum]ADZ72082.1 Flp pilus assembly protein, ATPase CpaE [Polymorphum gilvum SL003B-26A1]
MTTAAAQGNYGALPDETGTLQPVVQAPEIRSVPRISLQAFCIDPETAKVIEAAGEDRRMTKAHVKVHMGGIPASIEFYSQAPTPNLIVLESAAAPDVLVADLDRLAEFCDAGTKVIVIGHVNDVALYRELIHRGVSEYLVAPISVFQMIGAVGELYCDPQSAPLGRTIAFFGVKGGCGASTIAHNVAWSIARDFQNEVVLADLDLPFGTAGLDFNQDPLQGVYEAVSAPERLDETFLDRILSRCSDRLSLLAAPASLERTYDYSDTSFDALVDVMRQGTPTIVLDVPHAWNGWVKHMLVAADEVIMVAEPDLANLRNAKNLVDTLRHLRPNDGPPHLVMNRVNIPKRPEIKPDEFAKALNLAVLAAIPFEPQLFGTAANNGQMIAELDGKHAINEVFNTVSQVVSGRSEVKKSRRSPFGSLLSILRKGKGA